MLAELNNKMDNETEAQRSLKGSNQQSKDLNPVPHDPESSWA